MFYTDKGDEYENRGKGCDGWCASEEDVIVRTKMIDSSHALNFNFNDDNNKHLKFVNNCN